MRSAVGRNPYDRDLTDLVGELSTTSRFTIPPRSPAYAPLKELRHRAVRNNAVLIEA